MNSGLMEEHPVSLRYPSLRLWGLSRGKTNLSFSTSRLDTFQTTGKQTLYLVCVKFLNLASLLGYKELRWTEFHNPDVSPKGIWRCLFRLPVEKWTADHQWRVINGVIASNRYRVQLEPELREECVFCSQVESSEHLFVECWCLTAWFDLLKGWIEGSGKVEFFQFIYFWSKIQMVPEDGPHSS